MSINVQELNYCNYHQFALQNYVVVQGLPLWPAEKTFLQFLNDVLKINIQDLSNFEQEVQNDKVTSLLEFNSPLSGLQLTASHVKLPENILVFSQG